jgi:hypothetical protein
MPLTGPQYQALQNALLSAFPSRDTLAQMVRFQLGENLAVISEGGGLAATVFQLIQWAESQGRLAELVTGALQSNPGNPALRACAAQLGMATPSPTPSPAPTTGSSAPTSSPTPSTGKTPELFYSYAQKDEKLREQLEKHLVLLRRQGLITDWHDRKLVAGQERDAELLSRLERADIILLLVSPDFLASDFCDSVELQRVLGRQARGEALVIPIILRPCDWKTAPFSKLQALPRDAKAVSTWGNRDEAFTDIARGIRTAVENWRSKH